MSYKVHTYNVELEVLTPVIINTGEYYQFWELIPTEDRRELKDYDEELPLPVIYKSYVNDMSNVFQGMDSVSVKMIVDEMTAATAKRDNLALAKVRTKLIKASGTKGKLPVRMLPKAMKCLIDKPNQQVSKVASSPLDYKPYIPGSSIKGAIRTGILEQLRKKEGIDYWDSLTNGDYYYQRANLPEQRKIKDAQNFEMEVMKGKKQDFKVLDDPFKYLKVSDFTFSGIDGLTYIAKVGDDEKEPIYSAMTNSYAFSGKSVVARGTISVDDRFFKEINFGGVSDLKGALDMMCDFYLDNINSIKNEICTELMRYMFSKKLVEKLHKDENLIRFGHYTGIQNYTFKVNQVSPPFKAKADINKTGGRIVKLEEGVLPGICTIRIIDKIK